MIFWLQNQTLPFDCWQMSDMEIQKPHLEKQTRSEAPSFYFLVVLSNTIYTLKMFWSFLKLHNYNLPAVLQLPATSKADIALFGVVCKKGSFV